MSRARTSFVTGGVQVLLILTEANFEPEYSKSYATLETYSGMYVQRNLCFLRKNSEWTKLIFESWKFPILYMCITC